MNGGDLSKRPGVTRLRGQSSEAQNTGSRFMVLESQEEFPLISATAPTSTERRAVRRPRDVWTWQLGHRFR